MSAGFPVNCSGEQIEEAHNMLSFIPSSSIHLTKYMIRLKLASFSLKIRCYLMLKYQKSLFN